MGVIYSIMNPKGKLYVGKTYDLRKRINCHKHCARKGSSIIIHNSIRKYGWENHFLKVIEEVPDELLNEREIFWITTLKTYCYENKMGMNMTQGGEGQRSTWMHDTERRKKASEYFKGENNPFFGKKMTEENKRIVGEKASKRNKETGRIVPRWGAEKSYAASRVAVIAYDLNGYFLNEFISVSNAATYFKFDRRHISAVLSGRQIHANGIVFVKKISENYPKQLDMEGIKIKKINRGVLLLNDTRHVIKEYESAKEASVDLKIPKTTIARAAQYNDYHPIRTGHIFKYKDEHILN